MKMVETQRILWMNLQKVLGNAGPDGLHALGYQFAPIDNNPRHGLLSLNSHAIEVVERCGIWWVLPTRPFRFV